MAKKAKSMLIPHPKQRRRTSRDVVSDAERRLYTSIGKMATLGKLKTPEEARDAKRNSKKKVTRKASNPLKTSIGPKKKR